MNHSNLGAPVLRAQRSAKQHVYYRTAPTPAALAGGVSFPLSAAIWRRSAYLSLLASDAHHSSGSSGGRKQCGDTPWHGLQGAGGSPGVCAGAGVGLMSLGRHNDTSALARANVVLRLSGLQTVALARGWATL